MRLLDRFRREFVLRAASLFHSSFNINKQHFAVSSRSSVCSTHFSGIADGRMDHSLATQSLEHECRLRDSFDRSTQPCLHNIGEYFHILPRPRLFVAPSCLPSCQMEADGGNGCRRSYPRSLIYPWENILSGKQSRWRTRIYLPCL